MDWWQLIDPQSGLFVLGGTILATCLRSGRRELTATAAILFQSFAPRFDFNKVRAEIAPDVNAMIKDGVIRANDTRSRDGELIDATHELIRHRSISAMIDVHENYRRKRQDTRTRAVWTLTQAGELSPVFGMAGTLFALSQISTHSISSDNLLIAVATAVVTTLYGLLAAHTLFIPLACWAARSGEYEEEQRQKLIDWLTDQLSPICPRTEIRQSRAA